jgi:putative endonuclease
MDRRYFVYIMTNRKDGTLYVGVTNNIQRRVAEHASGEPPGFTKQYNLKRLVYYEEHNEVQMALSREKNMKAWKRQWKIDLIQKDNPDWKDFSLEF